MSRFVLFAQIRSGSSNLRKALQLHPDPRIAEAPFREYYVDWNPDEPNYLERIHDIESLEQQLELLFAKFYKIKILDDQLPEEFYAYLLLIPDLKAIVLRRKNNLQQAVSNLIALQTGIRKIWDLKGDIRDTYKNLQPLNRDAVDKLLQYRKNLNRFSMDVLKNKPKPLLYELGYESFYMASLATARECIRNLFRFLEVEPLDMPELQFYLDKSQWRWAS